MNAKTGDASRLEEHSRGARCKFGAFWLEKAREKYVIDFLDQSRVG